MSGRWGSDEAFSSFEPMYDTETGHAGGMPVSKQVEDTTNELLFLLWQLGEL